MSPKGNTPTRMGGAPRKLTPDEERLQECLGEQYQLVDLLGSGGMGTVYKAKQTNLDTYVAVKIVRDTAGDDASAIRRLKNEAQALASLEHANIVRVMSLIRLDDNQCALVMEFAEGQDLASIIKEEGKLQPERARRLLLQCVQALVVAHEAGIIHRDLKPANILVTKDGDIEKVKILDFGLAKLSESGNQKLTRTGTVMGSPAYMSPEQCTAASLDGRSDIYSLGCVFYEALVGKPPFEGDSAFEVLLQHTNERVPLIDCASDKSLADILAKCTERDKEQRFESAKQLLEALLSNGHYVYRATGRATVKPVKEKSRKFVVWAAVGLAISLGLCWLGYTMWTATSQREIARTTQESGAETKANRMVQQLHKLKKDKRSATPDELAEMKALQGYLKDPKDMFDLGNAFWYFELQADATAIRRKAVEQMWREGQQTLGHELSKVAEFYVMDEHPEKAKPLLQKELQYAQARGDIKQIAKAEFELMCFGELTADTALVEQMRRQLRPKLKDAGIKEALAGINSALLRCIRATKNKHFAEDLVPPAVPGTTGSAAQSS
jgi:eukaryotic-like serine/threonine-protein kinase